MGEEEVEGMAAMREELARKNRSIEFLKDRVRTEQNKTGQGGVAAREKLDEELRLQEALATRERQVQHLSGQIQRQHRELQRLQEELFRAHQGMMPIGPCQQCDGMQQHIQRLEGGVREESELRAEIQRLQQQLHSFGRERDGAEVQREASMAREKELIDRGLDDRKEMSQQKAIIKEKDERIRQLKSELTSVREKLNERDSQLQEQKRRHNTERSRLTSEIQQLKAELDTVKERKKALPPPPQLTDHHAAPPVADTTSHHPKAITTTTQPSAAGPSLRSMSPEPPTCHRITPESAPPNRSATPQPGKASASALGRSYDGKVAARGGREVRRGSNKQHGADDELFLTSTHTTASSSSAQGAGGPPEKAGGIATASRRGSGGGGGGRRPSDNSDEQHQHHHVVSSGVRRASRDEGIGSTTSDMLAARREALLSLENDVFRNIDRRISLGESSTDGKSAVSRDIPPSTPPPYSPPVGQHTPPDEPSGGSLAGTLGRGRHHFLLNSPNPPPEKMGRHASIEESFERPSPYSREPNRQRTPPPTHSRSLWEGEPSQASVPPPPRWAYNVRGIGYDWMTMQEDDGAASPVSRVRNWRISGGGSGEGRPRLDSWVRGPSKKTSSEDIMAESVDDAHSQPSGHRPLPHFGLMGDAAPHIVAAPPPPSILDIHSRLQLAADFDDSPATPNPEERPLKPPEVAEGASYVKLLTSQVDADTNPNSMQREPTMEGGQAPLGNKNRLRKGAGTLASTPKGISKDESALPSPPSNIQLRGRPGGKHTSAVSSSHPTMKHFTFGTTSNPSIAMPASTLTSTKSRSQRGREAPQPHPKRPPPLPPHSPAFSDNIHPEGPAGSGSSSNTAKSLRDMYLQQRDALKKGREGAGGSPDLRSKVEGLRSAKTQTLGGTPGAAADDVDAHLTSYLRENPGHIGGGNFVRIKEGVYEYASSSGRVKKRALLSLKNGKLMVRSGGGSFLTLSQWCARDGNGG
ncbi:unnamed protein product [Vitrella brassicaformis CCMP3155]|uniref:Uncharacterized protein n=1 Tax=Vitrella brassicaformis (strain CCMP3155) TaxID=1169540 RepID=A0A0G4EJY9_VITBC|nr:unnamed protein product [Vitrella brassicaformis CCMP3155]|eukprot:CEL96857.1 unnamed protein product [Vitrella brassicaformis CCMP3155]